MVARWTGWLAHAIEEYPKDESSRLRQLRTSRVRSETASGDLQRHVGVGNHIRSRWEIQREEVIFRLNTH